MFEHRSAEQQWVLARAHSSTGLTTERKISESVEMPKYICTGRFSVGSLTSLSYINYGPLVTNEKCSLLRFVSLTFASSTGCCSDTIKKSYTHTHTSRNIRINYIAEIRYESMRQRRPICFHLIESYAQQ